MSVEETPSSSLSAARALAEGDFTKIAASFRTAGLVVRLPAPGILQIAFPMPAGTRQRSRCLISVGMHGDETAPIEMTAQLLEQLAQTPQALAVDLMIVVGNIEAIAQGKRFVDADLNRMFRAERGDLAATREAVRADAIIAASADFFDSPGGGQSWHLDLHTAIRSSFYPTFAVVPDLIAAPGKAALVRWLADAGIGAIVMNPASAGTYSYYSAERFGAASATVELGRVGVLGQNDSSVLAEPLAALECLLQGVQSMRADDEANRPHVFRVAQEIIKFSDGFKMAFDSATQNFTRMDAGAVIATDGATVYRVGPAEEFVVFPNPDVRIGQRAGLMVVEE